jgi:hypothetical protein
MAGFARHASLTLASLHQVVQTNPSLTRGLVVMALELSVNDRVGMLAPGHLFQIPELEKALR